MAPSEVAPAARSLRLASRVVLATSRGPGRPLWAAVACGLARLAGRHAAGGAGASVYTRGGLGRGDFVPGISDIDVIVVASTDPAGRGVASERSRRRWRRAQTRLPAAYAVFGEPRIYDDAELAELGGSSAYSFGLDDYVDGAAFVNDPSLRDRLRLLDKPGLVSATDDWVRLSGPVRRLPGGVRSDEDELVAAWLELAFYWRHAFRACVRPEQPWNALLCVKLVAEPARILLRLTTGERFDTRTDVLRRAAELVPEEESAFRLALETEQTLARRPRAPLAEAVAALERLSRRIAETVTDAAFARGADEVVLVGSADPTMAHLCDWRATVSPTHVSEHVRGSDGDPADPVVLRRVALEQNGPCYIACRDGALLVLPAEPRERNRLRAVQCPASDPVTFAVLDRRCRASFPRTRGWSIEHLARRAVAEHRARLASSPVPEVSMLVGAARAGLLWESVRDGRPILLLTPDAVYEALAAGPDDPGLLDAVRRLAAYAI